MVEIFTIDLLDNLKTLRRLLNFNNVSQVRNFLNIIIKQVEEVKNKQSKIPPAMFRIGIKTSVIVKLAESVQILDTVDEVYDLLQSKYKKYFRKMEELAKGEKNK